MIVVAVAVVAGVAALVALAAEDGGDGGGGDVVVEQLGDRPFDEDGFLPGRPSVAQWSPDGNHLLQVTAQGAGLAVDGRFRPLTPAGARVGEVGWMPGANAVLVAEGPGFVSHLTVLDLTGRALGRVPLEPGFDVGSGYGLSVSADGRQAVVSALSRSDPIGPARRVLVAVDLVTGHTRLVPGATDATGPAFLASGAVAFTVKGAGEAEPSPTAGSGVGRKDGAGEDPYTAVTAVDGTGLRRLVSGRLIRPLDGGGVATVVGSTVRIDGTAVLRLESGAVVLDVHPAGRNALVRPPAPAGSIRPPRVRAVQIPRRVEVSMYREGP